MCVCDLGIRTWWTSVGKEPLAFSTSGPGTSLFGKNYKDVDKNDAYDVVLVQNSIFHSKNPGSTFLPLEHDQMYLTYLRNLCTKSFASEMYVYYIPRFNENFAVF